MRRSPALPLALAAASILLPSAAQAQKTPLPDTQAMPSASVATRPVEGRALVLRWPESQRTLTGRQLRRFAALPSIDTLQVGYRFTPSGAETVDLDLAVRWVPGATGILRGKRVPFAQMPDGLRLVAFTLQADVMQNGRRVATFTYAADSTRLAANDVFADRLAAPLARVFDGMTAEQARRVIAGGFTLGQMRLTRAVFTVPAAELPGVRTSQRGDTGGSMGEKGTVGRDEVSRQERVARERAAARDFWLTVYTVDRALDLAYYAAWMNDAYDRYVDDDDRRGELVGYALAAAAGVGAVAYWSGSAGVYGTGDTPLGLAAGYSRPNGGLLVHASTNLAALGGASGVERIDARLVGYRRLGTFPVMPMLATGMRFTDRPASGRYNPDRDTNRWLLSVGAAHNIGRAVALVGIEVMSGSPEVGVVWRWR